jgi:hypothetical protein
VDIKQVGDFLYRVAAVDLDEVMVGVSFGHIAYAGVFALVPRRFRAPRPGVVSSRLSHSTTAARR